MSKKSRLFQLINRQLKRSNRFSYREKQIVIDSLPLLVKPVQKRDIKALLNIEREAYAGEVPWNWSAFFLELESSQPHLYLLLEYKKKAVGFIGCRFENNDGHITNIAILPTFQGKGLGSFLLSEVKSFAKKAGYDSLSLEVRISNLDAQRLYRGAGFTSKALKKDYYHKNKEDAVEMICILEESC